MRLGRCPRTSLRSYDRPCRWGSRHPVLCRHRSSETESSGSRGITHRDASPRGSHLGGFFMRPLSHRAAGRGTHRDPSHLATAAHRVAHLTTTPPAACALGQPLDELLSGHCARAGDELPHGRGEEGHSVKTHRHQPRNSCRRTRWASANPAHTRWTSCRLDILRSDPTRMDSSWW